MPARRPAAAIRSRRPTTRKPTDSWRRRLALVGRDDRRLDRPDPVSGRLGDESLEECPADTAAAASPRRRTPSARRRRDSSPAARRARPRRASRRPRRPAPRRAAGASRWPASHSSHDGYRGLERGDPGREAVGVDARDDRPVLAHERADGDARHVSTLRDRRRGTVHVRLPAPGRVTAVRRVGAMDVVRPTPDRFDETLDVLRAADVAVYGDSDWTASDLRDEWDGLDLERDAWLVELDGRIAGVAHLLDRKGGRFIGDGYVHPELTGRGVGDRVLDLLEDPGARAPAGMARRTAGSSSRPRTSSATTGRRRSSAAVASSGYGASSGWSPTSAEQQPAPEWPDGVELRPLDVELRRPVALRRGARGLRRRVGVRPARRTTSGASAPSGDRASTRPSSRSPGTATRSSPSRATIRSGTATGASIGTLGVRPGWRRRGLGLSLLHESFRRFRETGETTVALGVDVENPTGATRLYERAGMRVLWQADVWQKELRPGA